MRKFLAFVLALTLAIPMLIGAFVLLSVRPWVLNRDFYKSSLTDERLFASIEAVMLMDKSESIEVGGMRFDGPSFRKAIMASLPKADINAFTKTAVDTTFDELEGKAGRGSGKIDLQPLTESLKRNATTFVNSYAESVPEGESSIIDPKDLSLLPQGLSRQRFKEGLSPLVDTALDAFFADLGPQIQLPDIRSASARSPFRGNAVASLTLGTFLTLGMGIAFWILAGFLWPKPWSGRFPFLGGTLIASSVVVLVIGLSGYLSLNAQSALNAMTLFKIPMPATEGMDLLVLRTYLASLAATITKGFFITGLIAASVGGGLVSMRWVAAAREI